MKIPEFGNVEVNDAQEMEEAAIYFLESLCFLLDSQGHTTEILPDDDDYISEYHGSKRWSYEADQQILECIERAHRVCLKYFPDDEFDISTSWYSDAE